MYPLLRRITKDTNYRHWDLTMAQSTFDLTLEGARRRVLVKITEIEDLTRRCSTAGGLNSATQTEAEALQHSISHWLWILRCLWYAEPIRVTSLGYWITDIAERMGAKLQVFTQIRKTMTVTEHEAGVQRVPDSAGGISCSEGRRLRLTPTQDRTLTPRRGR